MLQRAENELQEALSAVAESYHVALNGTPGNGVAIVHRITGDEQTYESDTPIMTRMQAQVYVYQYEYDQGLVGQIREALEAAGWQSRLAPQTLDNGYYRDEINATKSYQYTEE